MMYRLDLDYLVKELQGAKRILIQLPDGLKPQALSIAKHLEKHMNCEVLFWAGSNFGACDLPVGLELLGIDHLIHIGHTPWVY